MQFFKNENKEWNERNKEDFLDVDKNDKEEKEDNIGFSVNSTPRKKEGTFGLIKSEYSKDKRKEYGPMEIERTSSLEWLRNEEVDRISGKDGGLHREGSGVSRFGKRRTPIRRLSNYKKGVRMNEDFDKGVLELWKNWKNESNNNTPQDDKKKFIFDADGKSLDGDTPKVFKRSTDGGKNEDNEKLNRGNSFCEHRRGNLTKQKLTRHYHFPQIIMGYIQLIFNLFFIGIVVYFVISVVRTVRRDVKVRVGEYLSGLKNEIEQCRIHYYDNKCLPEERVPAMIDECLKWEQCMNRDPAMIGRARITAFTFADIINGFVEPISYKTMIFFSTLFFGSLFLSNFAFGYARNRIIREREPSRREIVGKQIRRRIKDKNRMNNLIGESEHSDST